MTGRVETDAPRTPATGTTADVDGAKVTAWSAADLAKLAAVLGRKWTPLIVVTLRPLPLRHGELCRQLSGVSRKVLHDSLDGLMEDGLVEKIIGIDDVGSASVAYGLTPLGDSLAPVLDAMQGWCASHLTEMLQRRLDEAPAIRVAPFPDSDVVTSE